MAILKIIHAPKKYHDETAYQDVINYCANPDKTPHGLIEGRKVDKDYAADEMETVATAFGKDNGVKLRHFVLSCSSAEGLTSPDVAKIAHQVTDYYAGEYQILYAVHESSEKPHAHFVMNMVSYQDGHRYQGKKQDYYKFQKHIKKILRPYGIKLTVCSSNNDFDEFFD